MQIITKYYGVKKSNIVGHTGWELLLRDLDFGEEKTVSANSDNTQQIIDFKIFSWKPSVESI